MIKVLENQANFHFFPDKIIFPSLLAIFKICYIYIY